MNKDPFKIIGRRVKYFLPMSSKFFWGEELIIKGIKEKENKLVLCDCNNSLHELDIKHVRYLNNMNIKIF